MSNFVTFFSDFLSVVVDFLSATPIFWFVALFILLFTVGIVRKILHI